jgi:hypothetical protein
MPVPYLANALNGWTKKKTCQVVTKTVVNHKVLKSTSNVILDINIQPVPMTQVEKKPADQRSWKWWSIIVKKGPLLKTDDKVIVDSITYNIMKVGNWSESGFQKYEAIEDYT